MFVRDILENTYVKVFRKTDAIRYSMTISVLHKCKEATLQALGSFLPVFKISKYVFHLLGDFFFTYCNIIHCLDMAGVDS